MVSTQRNRVSARTKVAAKWLAKVKKGQVQPKDSVAALSVVHLSPLGSQTSFNANAQRIESVTDWESIAKKYRAIMWPEEEEDQFAKVQGGQAGSTIRLGSAVALDGTTARAPPAGTSKIALEAPKS